MCIWSSSIRRRCSCNFLRFKQFTNGQKESLEDTAKVLGRFFDGIEYRGYKQQVVEDLAKYAGVPVWNGLTDIDHQHKF